MCRQPQAQAVEDQLGYFVNNVERMKYRTFRRQGFFIGSGVIEARFWRYTAFTPAADWKSFGNPGSTRQAALNDALPLAAW